MARYVKPYRSMRLQALSSACLFIALSLHMPFHALGQPGRNDMTFNVSDDGTRGTGPNGLVNDAAQQADGNVIIVGAFDRINLTLARGIGRMLLNGQPDGTFSSGSGFTGTGHPTGMALQPDGRIIVIGDFVGYNGAPRNRIVRILENGDVDPVFDPGTGANAAIRDVAVQSDGRILIVGDFITVGGAVRIHVARLLSNGSLDPSFTQPTTIDGSVHCVRIQNDGKVLIGGAFTQVTGLPRACIARLNTDGTIDTSFDPGTGVTGMAPMDGTGPLVNDIAVQSDNDIILVGAFDTFNGIPRGSIARVHSDGALDLDYTLAGGTQREVKTCELRSGDRLLIAGLFMDLGAGVQQLLPDGSADPIFSPGFHTNSVHFARAIGDGKCIVSGSFRNFEVDPPLAGFEMLDAEGKIHWPFTPGSGLNEIPWDILVQEDNKILVGGQFTRYNGEHDPWLIRLLSNGDRDADYPVGAGPNQQVRIIAAMNDGRIYIYGRFTAVDGTPCHGLARLHPDGGVDASFNAGPVTSERLDPVKDMAVMGDGRLVIVGEFTAVDGVARNCIARLQLNGDVDLSFNPTFSFGFSDPKINAVEISPEPLNHIWIGGDFEVVNNVHRNHLARLNINGSVDLSFDPGLGPEDGSSIGLTLTPDENILVFGGIDSYAGFTVDRSLVRVLGDGTRDPFFFEPTIPTFGSADGFSSSNQVNEVIVLRSGRIVICGRFMIEGDPTWNNVVTLLSTGLRDPEFADVGRYANEVFSLGIQQNCCDGKLIIGGIFTEYDEAVRHRIARLGLDSGVRLLVDAFLEGPWAEQAMTSDLGPAGYLPDVEPFSGMGFAHVGGGGEQADQGVFQQQGPAAIVDWIFLALRDAQQPNLVHATRSALLCADGNIVDMDGASSVVFKDVAAGAYRVSVHHRNHLAAMTAQPVIANQYGTFLDFTSPNVPLFGQDAMRETNGIRMLWAGDVNQDGKLLYTGQDNDRDRILSTIGGSIPTNTVQGYKVEDVNLDGVVKYTGEKNDRDPILRNIGGNIPTNVRNAQLP